MTESCDVLADKIFLFLISFLFCPSIYLYAIEKISNYLDCKTGPNIGQGPPLKSWTTTMDFWSSVPVVKDTKICIYTWFFSKSISRSALRFSSKVTKCLKNIFLKRLIFSWFFVFCHHIASLFSTFEFEYPVCVFCLSFLSTLLVDIVGKSAGDIYDKQNMSLVYLKYCKNPQIVDDIIV